MKQDCAQSTIPAKRLFVALVLLAFVLIPSLLCAQTKVTTKPSTAKPGPASK